MAVTVHHFETESPQLTIQIDAKEKVNAKGVKVFKPVCVEFLNHTFLTEKDEVAKLIKETDMFKSGQIWLSVDSPIRGANRPKVVSGARGADQEDRLLRKQLAEAQSALREANAKLAAKEIPKPA
jgi:hypothetical protein